jgi:hypothetical protein
MLLGNDLAGFLYSSLRIIASAPLHAIMLLNKQALYFVQRYDVTYIPIKNKQSPWP